jgi:hypothetical protein
MPEKWRAAYIIAESFRPKNVPGCSFEEFSVSAEQWANRLEQGVQCVPSPSTRDGIQAEIALREAGILVIA